MATFVYFTEDPTSLTITADTLPQAARQVASQVADADTTSQGTYVKRLWIVPADGIKAVDATITIRLDKSVQVALVP